MSKTNNSSDRQYLVVRNDEEQYSIWPADRPAPVGWYPIGPATAKDGCLDRIRLTWTDQRPKSLREASRG